MSFLTDPRLYFKDFSPLFSLVQCKSNLKTHLKEYSTLIKLLRSYNHFYHPTFFISPQLLEINSLIRKCVMEIKDNFQLTESQIITHLTNEICHKLVNQKFSPQLSHLLRIILNLSNVCNFQNYWSRLCPAKDYTKLLKLNTSYTQSSNRSRDSKLTIGDQKKSLVRYLEGFIRQNPNTQFLHLFTDPIRIYTGCIHPFVFRLLNNQIPLSECFTLVLKKDWYMLDYESINLYLESLVNQLNWRNELKT